MNPVAAYQAMTSSSPEQLVLHYLPLVKQIALHLAGRLPPSVDLDDLMQIGLIGLLQARESYDASQGASFQTYAGIRIKGAMLDELRNSDWLPRSVQANFRKVARAIETATSRVGRTATDTEVAAELGLSLAEYHTLTADLARARMGRLDDQSEALPADEFADPFQQAGEAGFSAALAQAVTALPEKERLMMSLYYGDELNLKEIGQVLGVSESRVSQLHGQALARVRAMLVDWSA